MDLIDDLVLSKLTVNTILTGHHALLFFLTGMIFPYPITPTIRNQKVMPLKR